MKSIITGESGNTCGHCGFGLVWKEHKSITDKMRRQAFYFSKWEYCSECSAVWFKEEFKVWNKNAAAQQLKNYEEYNEQLAHLRSIE